MADFFQNMFQSAATFADVWYFVVPFLGFPLFEFLWVEHINGKYSQRVKWVLLEIIPPPEIEKGPLPMEYIYSGFAGVEKTLTTVEEYVVGEYPVSFSLEIVSTEGKVHFYIRTQAGYRNLVEATFYAHYPNVEIHEVPDYVRDVPTTVPNKDWNLWGTDYVLVKDDLYPIRTYKYFEESITGTMVDPLAEVIEIMGKMGPGEHLWLQFIVTPLHPRVADSLRGTIDEFLGKEEVAKAGMFARLFHDLGDIISNLFAGLLGRELTWTAMEEAAGGDDQPVEFRLTPGQKDVLKALESNLGKQQFRTKMRHIYLGRRENFNKPTGVSGFIGSIKQFNDINLNNIKPDDSTKTYANYIFTEPRLLYRQRRLFRRYINRDTEPAEKRFILSTEELATLYHIPDMSVAAPSLTRVSTKRGGAPSNLPVQ